MELEAYLKSEVKELFVLAETADGDQLPDEMKVGDEIARRQEQLEGLAEAKKVLEARAQARYEAEKAEYEAKVRERTEKAAQTGKKARGQPVDRLGLYLQHLWRCFLRYDLRVERFGIMLQALHRRDHDLYANVGSKSICVIIPYGQRQPSRPSLKQTCQVMPDLPQRASGPIAACATAFVARPAAH